MTEQEMVKEELRLSNLFYYWFWMSGVAGTQQALENKDIPIGTETSQE